MTNSRDVNIRAAAKMGYTQTETAEILGITPSGVSRRAAQLGVRFISQFETGTGGRKEQYPEVLVAQAIESSHTWAAAALKLGWGDSSLHKWRRRHPHRLGYKLGANLATERPYRTVREPEPRPKPRKVWPDLTPGDR